MYVLKRTYYNVRTGLNVPASGSLSAFILISVSVMYAVCLSVAACPNRRGTFSKRSIDGLENVL